jgi:hypothetical protein
MPWIPELFSAPILQQLEEKRRDKLVTVPFFDGILTGELDALIGSFAGEPELYHPVRGRIRGSDLQRRQSASRVAEVAPQVAVPILHMDTRPAASLSLRGKSSSHEQPWQTAPPS